MKTRTETECLKTVAIDVVNLVLTQPALPSSPNAHVGIFSVESQRSQVRVSTSHLPLFMLQQLRLWRYETQSVDHRVAT